MPISATGKYSMNPQMGKGSEPPAAKADVRKEEAGDKMGGEGGGGKHMLKTEIHEHEDGSHGMVAHHRDGHVEHSSHPSMEEAHSASMDHFENNGGAEPDSEERMEEKGAEEEEGDGY